MSGKKASLREHRTGRKAKQVHTSSDSRLRDRPVKQGRKLVARENIDTIIKREDY